MRTHTFLWLNTIVADYWRHQPGPAYAEIVAAVSREASQRGVTLIDPPQVQVVADEQLPEGLLKVVVHASALPPAKKQTVPPPIQPRRRAKHGTRSKYSAGCRCDDCSKAESVYQAARYQRRKAQMQEAS